MPRTSTAAYVRMLANGDEKNEMNAVSHVPRREQGGNRSKQVGHMPALPAEGPLLPPDIISRFICACVQQPRRLSVSGNAIPQHSTSTGRQSWPSLHRLPIDRSAIDSPRSTMATLGDDLLGTVNRLQDLVFNTIGNDSLDLPQIVRDSANEFPAHANPLHRSWSAPNRPANLQYSRTLSAETSYPEAAAS
jgi:hypothetical protein